MISGIVFSKDRPMQLDAFLQTAARYAPFFSLTVIYLYTGEEYLRGYDMVRAAHPEAAFIKETVLKKNILDILSARDCPDCASFFCDDDLFFRPVDPASLALAEDELCYSLRLGLNTTYCYIYDKKQKYKGDISGDRLKWKYKEGEWDFAYPFSVDGHIFRTADLLGLIGQIPFSNPHHFENNLAQMTSPRERMVSGKQGCLVGVPHNKVHTVFDFRSAEGSAYELNRLFLEGKRIDPFAMDYSAVRSVHEELPYVIL